MKIEGYSEFGTMVSAEVPNNSIFRDVADNVVKIKNNVGVVSVMIYDDTQVTANTLAIGDIDTAIDIINGQII